MPSSLERYRGCLLGGAVGDALGAPVEFMSLAEIRQRFGAAGVRSPAEAYGRVGAITDDTQMTLFTAEGLLQAADRLERGIGNPPYMVWLAYQRWLATQGVRTRHEPPGAVWNGELLAHRELHSRRAPGNTCLSALARPWRDPAPHNPVTNTSKGCGAVMRAAPCGLIGTRWNPNAPFQMGKLTGMLSHGHPSGYLPAGALALIVHAVVEGDPAVRAVGRALEALEGEREAGETIAALRAAHAAARDHGPSPEVLETLGAGWVGEQALAIAVYAALCHPTDLAAGVRLAVNHGGDSDSTGAIAGNILGAALGVGAIPGPWLDVLELRDMIDRLAVAMHRRLVEGTRDTGWDAWRGVEPAG